MIHKQKASQLILLNQPEFLFQPLAYFRSYRSITPSGCFVAELFQVALRRVPFRRRVIREGVAEVTGQVKRAIDGNDKLDRNGN